MSARKSPPVAAVVLGVLVLAAVGAVVWNRLATPDRDAPPNPVQPVPRADPLAQLRQALDANPDDLDALHDLMRTLRREEKAEIGDRLARSAKPKEHFDSLFHWAGVDGDEPAKAALLAGLKKALPDDPRWGCDELQRLVRAGMYAHAATRFGELGRAAGADARSQYLVTFLQAMRSAGRAADAYAAVPDADAATALRTLAAPLESLILSGNATAARDAVAVRDAAKTDLRALLAAHHKRTPDDPSLRYLEGVLLQGDGEFEKAQRVYADGMTGRPVPPRLKPGEWPKPGEWAFEHEKFRERRVQCLYKLGRAVEAYAEVPPVEFTFRQLAFAFQTDKKTDGLAELVAAHAKRFPDAPELPYWNGEVLFARGEYAKAAEAFAALDKTANLPFERRVGSERLVRALLRAGKAGEAQLVLDRPSMSGAPASLRVAVLAARGDLEGVERTLEVKWPQTGGRGRFYSDADFAREIAAPKFAAIREKYPDGRLK